MRRCAKLRQMREGMPAASPHPEHLAEVAREYETVGARIIGSVTEYALRLMRWNTLRKS